MTEKESIVSTGRSSAVMSLIAKIVFQDRWDFLQLYMQSGDSPGWSDVMNLSCARVNNAQ